MRNQRTPSPRAAVLATLVLCALVLAGCESQRGQRIEDIPTLASIDAVNTAQPLTQNAPPPPFNRDQVAFARIDAGLSALSGWRYEVQLEFTGAYTDTPLPAEGSARAQVWFNQLASARRVVFETSGGLFGAAASAPADTRATPGGPLIGGIGGIGATATPMPAALTSEAVRLGPDAFLVRGGVCSGGEAAATAADLSAGDLIGGLRTITPAGRQTTLNGQAVFAYAFAPGDLLTPMLRTAEGGPSSVSVQSADVWLAPAHGVIVRYYANLAVERMAVLGGTRPVTGTLLVRYDLYDIGQAYNITVPFGC